MENKTKLKIAPKPQGKLTYEQLNKIAADLSAQNQQLVERVKQLSSALEHRDFDYTSFFLSMLFKVLEHPDMYKDAFVKWCSENIEAALTSFAKATQESREDEAQSKNEAE